MGSKRRFTKYIVPYIQKYINENNVKVFIDIFCLEENTNVYTDQGIISIKDLKIGDYIYDENCELKKVINKRLSPEKTGVKIKTKGNLEFNTTKTHKFYNINNKEIEAQNLLGESLLIGKDCRKEYIEFIDMANFVNSETKTEKGYNIGGQIINNDFIQVSHLKESIIPRYLKVDENLMYCYGLVVAEGDQHNLTMHVKEKEYLEKFIKIYEKLINRDFKKEQQQIYYYKKNTIECAIPHATFYKKIFFDAMQIGSGARNKNITFLFKVKPELALAAIQAMHIGDGCLRRKGKYYSWNYKTSSKTLAYQLQTLLSIKFGIKSTLSHGMNKPRKIENRELQPTDYYNISVNRYEDICFLMGWKNEENIRNEKTKKFVVTSIEPISGTFYDITLEDNSTHRFILDGGIVNHNCGGANLTDKIKCDKVFANDLSPTLIALHRQVQSDPSRIPETGSRQWWDDAYSDYKNLKANYPIDSIIWEQNSSMPLWQIGAIEWYSSFANGGFPRGYAKPSHGRDYYNEAYRNHQKQAQEENYKKIEFIQGSYLDLNIQPNVLIYCDSPYKGTKPYAINPKFNYEEYYNWLREQSKTNPIFISEQSMPEDFQIVWSKDDVTRTAGLDNNYKACEKLFFIDNR